MAGPSSSGSSTNQQPFPRGNDNGVEPGRLLTGQQSGSQVGPRHSNLRHIFRPPPPPPLPSTPARPGRPSPPSSERRQLPERRFQANSRGGTPELRSVRRDGQRPSREATGSGRRGSSRNSSPCPAPRIGLSRRETLREADARRRKAKAKSSHASQHRKQAAGKRDRQEAPERDDKRKDGKSDRDEKPEKQKRDASDE